MPRVVCPKCGHANSDLRERCVSCKAKLPPSDVKPIGRTAADAAPAARKALKLSVSKPRPVKRNPEPQAAKPNPPKEKPPRTRAAGPEPRPAQAPRKRPPPAPAREAADPAPAAPSAEPSRPATSRPAAASVERLIQESPESGVESFFHREPRTIPRVEIREFEPAEGEPSDGDADADVAAVPTEDAFVPSRPEDDRRWPTVRRLLLMLEAFPALAFAAAAAWNRRSDFLWVALAAGALPLLYSLAGAFRARGARSRRVVAALVMAVALGGSSFLVFRDCANRLKPAGNLSGCDLSDTSLAGLDLQGANLTGADLSGADLSRAVLGGADLTDADLRGADLSGADLSDAKLSGADLRGARLQEAGLERVTLTDANLAELDLSGLVLAGLDLSRARLSGADLTETDLTGAILDAALLDGAQLVRTSLAHASLRGASLFGATVLESDLSNARLNGVTLQEADIRVVSLVGATGFAMAELAAALGVPPREIGRGLSTHLVRLQLRAEVLGALGGACRGAPVEHAVQDSGDFHPLAIASAGGGASPMSRQALLHGWEPMATRFGDLVACLSPEVAETVEVCPGTAGAAGPPGRIQFTRQVRVVRVRTGAVVLDRVYRGSDPKPCPAAAEDNVRGSHVSFHALQADFTHLVMP